MINPQNGYVCVCVGGTEGFVEHLESSIFSKTRLGYLRDQELQGLLPLSFKF